MGGSSSTQSTQIPDYMSDAGRLATQRANMIYEAGRMPFTGIDVVAINPAEQAAIDQATMAASAFGMPSAAANPFEGMEMLESGGLRGYSSYPIYIADMTRLKEQRPDQYAALARQSGFDPITGQAIAPPVSPIGASQPRADVAAFLKSQEPHRDEGSRMPTGRESRQTGPSVPTSANGYPNMSSMPAIRGYTTPDKGVLGNVADDVGSFIRGGGLMGAIGRAMSGRN